MVTLQNIFALVQGNVRDVETISYIQKIKKNQVMPKAMEILTVTHEMGIPNGDGGTITWKATINYNPSTSRFTLVKMEATPNFSSATPGLILSGVRCSPSSGNRITGSYVTVYFTVGSLFAGTAWDYSCKVYL